MNQFSPICLKCNTPLIRKEGKRGVYFACPNWKKDGTGCEGEIVFPPKETLKSGGFQKEVIGNEEILTALREIWKELEKLNKSFANFCQIFGNKKE